MKPAAETGKSFVLSKIRAHVRAEGADLISYSPQTKLTSKTDRDSSEPLNLKRNCREQNRHGAGKGQEIRKQRVRPGVVKRSQPQCPTEQASTPVDTTKGTEEGAL